MSALGLLSAYGSGEDEEDKEETAAAEADEEGDEDEDSGAPQHEGAALAARALHARGGGVGDGADGKHTYACLLYTSPSPRD